VDDGFQLLRGRSVPRQMPESTRRLHAYAEFHEAHLHAARSRQLREAIAEAGTERQSTQRGSSHLPKAEGLLRHGDERIGAAGARETNHRHRLRRGGLHRGRGDLSLGGTLHAPSWCVSQTHVRAADESGQLVLIQQRHDRRYIRQVDLEIERSRVRRPPAGDQNPRGGTSGCGSDRRRRR